MQIHEYLTEIPQIGRRDFRVYPPNMLILTMCCHPQAVAEVTLLEWEEEEGEEV